MKSYTGSFNQLCELGSGTYGKVYKVQDRGNSSRYYAVKKIMLKDSGLKNKQEISVRNLTKSGAFYVVEYFDSWIENNYLFIQMEFCSNNVRNIIRQKADCFQRRALDAMNSIEYFICCQMFKEMLESVQYLHGLRPSIIHKNLKPENILISEYPRNGRFLKLCDFDPVTYDGQANLSNNKTSGYVAPEVMHGENDQSKYNTKTDIYSLGAIAQDLFELDLTSEINPIVKNMALKSEWICLVKLITRMKNGVYRERPTCAAVLSKFMYWCPSVHQKSLTKDDHATLSNYRQQFFIEFLRAKI